MGILRTDRVSGLGGANAIKGSVFFGNGEANEPSSSSSRTGNDFLRTEHSSNFTFGTGDLTMEGWFFIETLSDDWQTLIADSIYYAQGGFTFYINNTQLIMYNGQGGGIVNGGTLTAAKWSHLAYSRESNSHKLFIDGELVATASSSYEFTGTDIIIGVNKVGQSSNADTGGYPFRGFASNVRIIKGRALYTATFTPPKGELEVTSDTVLLCCQSPGNVLQEATGVTLTTSTHRNSSGAKASHFTPNSPVGFSTTSDVGTQFGSTFDGVTTFDSQAYMVMPGGNTRERNRGRGIFADGDQSTDIEFVNIQSMGNSQEFGDSTTTYKQRATVGSSTRAVTAGGFDSPAFTNIIDFITIANTSNATDFGDLLTAKRNMGGAGNNTRGIYLGGGSPSNTNTIEFITIATAGNAQDFGDATESKSGVGSLASPTRACFGGGQENTIEFVTIATTGNATDFGDLLTGSTEKPAGTSSSTRGLFICGETQPSGTRINTIQFITIASTGNATDFGDHTDQRRSLGACNNSIRAVYGGGNTSSATVNSLSFVTIASAGNGQDFGDLLSARSTALTTTSDSHGGLS
jgi:hypothetical protein